MIAAPKQLGIPGIAGVLTGELIVDLFAGGGGASSGIEQALGRPPDIAINHDPHAVQMHEANHPATHHRCESVYDVDPVKVTGGQAVGLLWLSPDCRHFSRAKGSAPVSKSVRALAWIGLRWAKTCRPRVVCLENVPEFLGWGPLLADGTPNPDRKGETFAAFVREWKRYGYVVEWRTLVAADFGAPTTRKRLFLIARCDGEPIEWPERTHGKGGTPLPWRTAAECIDWSIPCPSIFERKRPLAPATCRRIARGITRYVLQGKPFLVQIGQRHERGDGPTDKPFGTVMPTQRHALVAPFLAKHNGGTTGQPLDGPVHTLTGRDQKALVAAHLSVFREGHRSGDLGQPVPTLTAGGGRGGGRGGGSMAVVAAFLVHYYSSGTQDQALDGPLATIVSRARHGLVTVTIDGAEYAIVDIGMRMLAPRELAAAQGFPASYVLTGTKSQQIARIGNSVCPPVAAAVVGANLGAPSRKRSAA